MLCCTLTVQVFVSVGVALLGFGEVLIDSLRSCSPALFRLILCFQLWLLLSPLGGILGLAFCINW